MDTNVNISETLSYAMMKMDKLEKKTSHVTRKIGVIGLCSFVIGSILLYQEKRLQKAESEIDILKSSLREIQDEKEFAKEIKVDITRGGEMN